MHLKVLTELYTTSLKANNDNGAMAIYACTLGFKCEHKAALGFEIYSEIQVIALKQTVYG